MTDEQPVVFTLVKDEIKPSCGDCGCPATAMLANPHDVDGEIYYRCGHCHDAAPVHYTETPETHWPSGEPEFDDSIEEIMEDLL